VQPKASVAANTGSGLDLAWGLHTLPQLFPTKVLKMNDVADYLGKKYGGWTDAAAATCKQGNDWLGIPVATIGGYITYRKSLTDKAGFSEIPEGFPGFPGIVQGLKKNNTPPASRSGMPPRRQWLAALDPVGSRRLYGRQGRQGHHQLAGNREGAGILQALSDNFIPASRPGTTRPTTRRSCRASFADVERHLDLCCRQDDPSKKELAEDTYHALWPVGRSANRPNCSSRFRSWRSLHQISERREAFVASCWRRKTTTMADGYLVKLNARDRNASCSSVGLPIGPTGHSA